MYGIIQIYGNENTTVMTHYPAHLQPVEAQTQTHSEKPMAFFIKTHLSILFSSPKSSIKV